MLDTQKEEKMKLMSQVCLYMRFKCVTVYVWFCCAWQVRDLTSENEDLRKKQVYMTAIDEENTELFQKIDVSEKRKLQ